MQASHNIVRPCGTISPEKQPRSRAINKTMTLIQRENKTLLKSPRQRFLCGRTSTTQENVPKTRNPRFKPCYKIYKSITTGACFISEVVEISVVMTVVGRHCIQQKAYIKAVRVLYWRLSPRPRRKSHPAAFQIALSDRPQPNNIGSSRFSIERKTCLDRKYVYIGRWRY